ncbi:MAG: PAS domain S-box-containing protein [Myxococcota bacterium]|jgi:PAS domain S-box-containing protein
MLAHGLDDLSLLTMRAADANGCAIVLRFGGVSSVAATRGITATQLDLLGSLLEQPVGPEARQIMTDDPALIGSGLERAVFASTPMVGPDAQRAGAIAVVYTLFPKSKELALDVAAIVQAAARQVARRTGVHQAKFAVAPENYARLADITDTLLAVSGMDGFLKQLNSAWTRTLGWSVEELTSQSYMNFVHPDDIQRTMDEAAALTSERSTTVAFENRYRCKDGSYRWLSWNVTTNPSESLIYCVILDVTEQVALRKEVEHSRALLERTSTLAKVGGWVYGIGAPGPVWSKEVYKIHEAPEDYVPTIEEAVNFYPPSARTTISEAIDAAIRNGSSWDQELPFITARGNRKWVRAAGEPVFDENGECIELRGIFQDISDRMQAETAKQEFVATVSHELRTPLTSIAGSLRLIEAGVVGKLPEQAEKLVELANRNVTRLVRLINDILDLTSHEVGRQTLRLETTDLDALVHRVTDGSRGLAAESDVRLVLEACPIEMQVDPDRIEQVVSNFLSNAIKFSPAGSLITVSVTADVTQVRVAVTDQGQGIAAEDHDTVFERFHQLDSSATRGKGGTGLGLAICKALVEQHGGTIGLDSEVGVGSTFWFTLDLPDDAG